MLYWSQRFETGIPLVDTQHKTLFDYINRLEIITGQSHIDNAQVDELIDFLETYVSNHFRFEENCMNRYHCPAHLANQQAHAKFLEVWGKFRAAYAKQGPQVALLKKLHLLAENWIQNHICKVDIGLRNAAPSARA